MQWQNQKQIAPPACTTTTITIIRQFVDTWQVINDFSTSKAKQTCLYTAAMFLRRACSDDTKSNRNEYNFSLYLLVSLKKKKKLINTKKLENYKKK